MKWLKRIVAALIILLVVLVAVGLLLPQHSHVERSIVINAEPAVVFNVVNGFGEFNQWSPWAGIDPDHTRYTFSGPTHGVGARMAWTSPASSIGNGSQEIIVSKPHSSVVVKLDFDKQGSATGYFAIRPVETGSEITWGFDADHGYNLLSRYFGLLYDKLGGADYEKGLANLKAYVESLPPPAADPAPAAEEPPITPAPEAGGE